MILNSSSSSEEINANRHNIRSQKLKIFFLSLAIISAFAGTLAPYSLQIFPNGLKLIVERNTHSKRTVAYILINGGKIADPVGKGGLGYLVALLSAVSPDSESMREFMKMGAEIRIASYGDFLLIASECLSSNFERTMKLVFRNFSHPIFSEIRINDFKEMLKNKQRMEFDSVDSRAEMVLFNAFFGSKGYGQSSYGTSVSMESIKNDDVKSYHRQYFVGANITMAVVSDLEESQVSSIIRATFSRLPKGEGFVNPAPWATLLKNKQINLEKEKEQVYLAIGFPLPPLTEQNYILAKLLESILSGTPESKLWLLRAEGGLAYEFGSKISLLKGSGLLIIYLKTSALKYLQAKTMFREIIGEIDENGLSEEDLKMGRNWLRSLIYQQLEDKGKRAEALVFHCNFNFVEETLRAYLETVTLDQISAYFNDVVDLNKAVFLDIISNKR